SSDRTARVLQKLLQSNASFRVCPSPIAAALAWTFLTHHPGDAHYIATFSPSMLPNQIICTTSSDITI
ncbi:MAG TPA: hypothetical protein VGC70_16775, partial [Burkholderiales bacterium]